jgi:hypothetical protein
MKRMVTIALLVAAGLLSALGASAHVQPSAHPRFAQHNVPPAPVTETCRANGANYPVAIGFGRIYLVICG